MNKNRKLTRFSKDFILAFSEKLRKEEKNWICRPDQVYQGYITSTMLNGIYNVLINEGYSKEHLDKFFFNEDYPNKYKEWTKEACKFYFINRENSSKVIEEFFNQDPAGIKLRKEIDKLSEKFNQ